MWKVIVALLLISSPVYAGDMCCDGGLSVEKITAVNVCAGAISCAPLTALNKEGC